MRKLWSKSGSVFASDCLSTFRQYLLSKGAVSKMCGTTGLWVLFLVLLLVNQPPADKTEITTYKLR